VKKVKPRRKWKYIHTNRKITPDEQRAMSASLIRHAARRSQADRDAAEATNEAWEKVESGQQTGLKALFFFY